MVPDFEPSWSGQAVMSELDGWDSNVPNIDRSHHRHRSRTLVTEKPWTEWRTVLTVRRLITVKSAQKLGRHEVDSIHSQPPLHCPSDEAGDGLAVGGLYLAVGGHVPPPPPLPTPTFSNLTTSPNICLWILHQPLDAKFRFRTSVHQLTPKSVHGGGPWPAWKPSNLQTEN